MRSFMGVAAVLLSVIMALSFSIALAEKDTINITKQANITDNGTKSANISLNETNVTALQNATNVTVLENTTNVTMQQNATNVTVLENTTNVTTQNKTAPPREPKGRQVRRH